jgi:hypothetical protein
MQLSIKIAGQKHSINIYYEGYGVETREWDDVVPDCPQCGCPLVHDDGIVPMALDKSIVECPTCEWKTEVIRG